MIYSETDRFVQLPLERLDSIDQYVDLFGQIGHHTTVLVPLHLLLLYGSLQLPVFSG